MGVVLLGAGGHARGIVEMLAEQGVTISAYADLKPCDWIGKPRVAESDIGSDARVAFGIGGTTPEQLARRLAMARAGWTLVAAVHKRAIVSPSARVDAGAHVMAGAVVQANARVGRLSIINTSAVVDHDAEIGEGTHVAPGALVLGGARIGRAAMIGAGAVVLPQAIVPDGALLGALKIWRDA
jgi:hypothetical protein